MKTSVLKNGDYTVKVKGPKKIANPRELFLVLTEDWISGEDFLSQARAKQGKNYAAKNLKYYRKAAKMTQTKLASAVGGDHRHHISEMESGKRPIGKAMARKLSEALGIEEMWMSLLTEVH